jgi:hypothetical protein
MWVSLARVSPELLGEVIEKPTLLDAMLFEDEDPKLKGFDRDGDVFGEDYRHMFVPYFEHVAEVEGDDPDDFDSSKAVQADPMYRAITGDNEIDYDFCYGPAMYNGPETVKEIASSWEGQYSKQELADTERMDVALYLFYKGAAEEGRAVICGIS